MEPIKITTKDVSRETFTLADRLYERHREALELYLDRLLWWNKRVNLVSRSVSRETIAEHMRHCLLISALPEFQAADTILDAGTGGGLPGIPLAITHPKKQFLLNDIVSKKCMALKQMVRRLQIQNVRILDGSVEQTAPEDPFLLISKHAFKINDLVAMTEPLPWQTMILYKGRNFDEEVKGLNTSIQIQVVDLSQESDFYTDKALVVIRRDQ